MGSGCSTLVDHQSPEQKLTKSWVQLWSGASFFLISLLFIGASLIRSLMEKQYYKLK